MKVLFITKKFNVNAGGRELLSLLNYNALDEIFSSHMHLVELAPSNLSFFMKCIAIFQGYIDGLSYSAVSDILNKINSLNVTHVFIDGSNLGLCAKSIKKKFPKVKIIVFFHNVEARFFWGAFKAMPSIHSFGVLLANYLAEKKSIKYSNQRIALNHRDSSMMKSYYGLNATDILPLAMTDKLPDHFSSDELPMKPIKNFALFVGGDFFANKNGIIWFIENVIPKINIPITIVGRGQETLKEKYGNIINLEIIGEVESVNDWYSNCQFVIAPIFDGSGMKTKVAEALMFGRKVIGTTEAFVGYEEFINQAGWVCDSAEDFIIAINDAQKEILQPFHLELRDIFIQQYSQQKATLRLKKILQSS